MKNLFYLAAFLFVTAFRATAQDDDNLFAGAPTQFSVDVIITGKSGDQTLGRQYVDGNKHRVEMESPTDVTLILRGDLKLEYTLYRSRKVYAKRKLTDNEAKELDRPQALSKDLRVTEKMGAETMNGELCDKFRLSKETALPQASPSASETPSAFQAFIWVSRSTHLSVKYASNGGVTIDYKNLSVGPQDPALFEPPADYKNTYNPSE